MTRFSASDLPDLSGKTAVVTGANSGIGLATARALAGAGARVVFAVRDVERGRAAAASMRGRSGLPGVPGLPGLPDEPVLAGSTEAAKES